MVFFKDFGKTVTDLFKPDKYKLNRTVEVKASSAQAEWTTKTVINPTGQLSSKLTYKQCDASLGSVEIKVPTKGNMEIDYQVPEKVDGLKTNIVICQPNMDLKAKYKRSSFKSHVKLQMNTEKTRVDSVYADASIGFEGLTLGGAAKLKPGADTPLADYNVGLVYEQNSDTSISVTTSDCCDSISASFWRRYSPSLELAARVGLAVESIAHPCVELGARWKCDENGTVQGVLSTNGDAMFLYKHKLSKMLTASLGCQVDTKTMKASSTSVHYKLLFNA
jgi:hypothetical protein